MDITKTRIPVLLLALCLSACVTTTDSRFTKKQDKEKALENYVHVSKAYIQKNNLPRAKKASMRALEIDSSYAPAHDALAIIMQKDGEHEIAEQHFKKALKHDKNFSLGRSHYGAFLYLHQRYDEAYAQLKQAADDAYFDSRPLAYEHLGLTALRLGKTSEAVQAYERSYELDRSRASPLLGLAQLYFSDKDLVKSKQQYQRFVNHIGKGSSQQSASSLWLGIQLAREFYDKRAEQDYAEILAEQFADSKEFAAYQSSLAGNNPKS